MLPLRENPEQEKTLVSWKEIASFLDHAERTVKRWEHERGLPVHRIPGGERGGVFAYPGELRAWMRDEEGKTAQSRTDLDGEDSSDQAVPPPENELPAQPKEPVIAVRGAAPQSEHHWARSIAVPAIMIGLAGVAVILSSRLGNPGVSGNSLPAKASRTGTHVPSPRAEEFYLQGRYQWSLRTAESLSKSIDAYTQAIVEDPAYASAYAGLAESYDLLPEFARVDQSDAFSRAKAAAQRAIELDSNLAAGHRAKAFALFYGDWDAPGSDAEFRKAIALAPNEVETHHWYATTLFSRHEKSQSLAEIDAAVRLSPTNPAILADAAFLHYKFNENPKASIRSLFDLARTQPKLVKASRYLEGIDLDDGDYEAYLAEISQAASISANPDESALAAASERGWKRGGTRGMFLAIRDFEQARYARGGSTGYELARAFVQLGQPLTALRYFNAALENHDIRMTWLQSCSCVAALRTDVDYLQLFRRVNQYMDRTSAHPLNLAVTTPPEKLANPRTNPQSH